MVWLRRRMLIVGITFCVPWMMKAQDASTMRMVERLAALDRSQDLRKNPYLSDRRVELMKRSVAGDDQMGQQIMDRFRLAQEYVRANMNEEAIAEFEQLRILLKDIPKQGLESLMQDFSNLEALAWIRLGEQENCVMNHSADSCLFPISGTGIHTLPRGSTMATQVLMENLAMNPQDLKARWLLNLAAMTLGKYPLGVPEEHRIPESSLHSDYPLPRFRDIGQAAGISVNGLAGGGAMTDFNGDGFLDLMVSSWSLEDQVHLLINKGDGSFDDHTEKAGLIGITGGLNMQYADYDNDGDQDVLILRGAWLFSMGHHPNSLLRNNGDGTFSDVTEAAGLLTFHPTQTAAWADFNNDGWLDVFIGNESTKNDPHGCELFLGNGDGTFFDVASASGVEVDAWVKGVTAGDYDNDGDQDLYVSILDAPNRLFRNDGTLEGGGIQFFDVSQSAGVSQPVESFPCWFWDYDNDGWEDLLVMGYRVGGIEDVAASYLGLEADIVGPRLYRNRGDGTFEDKTRSAGLEQCWLPMGSNFGDLDNDGFLDFYVGTGDPSMDFIMPNKMYRNDGGYGFQDVTTAGGFGHLQKGHAVSFGDFDNDGDQDVHTVMGGAFSGDRYMNALFENPGNGNGWIKLMLIGEQSNRSAIGARIQIRVVEEGSRNSIRKTVSTGSSFGGNPLRQEIGLGLAQSIESVEVFWPKSGIRRVYTGLDLRKSYILKENSNRAVEWQLPTLARMSAKEGHPKHH